MQKMIAIVFFSFIFSVYAKDFSNTYSAKGYFPEPGEEAIIPGNMDSDETTIPKKNDNSSEEYNPKQPRIQEGSVNTDMPTLLMPWEGGKGYFPDEDS